MTPEQYKKLTELIDISYTAIGIDALRRGQLVSNTNQVLRITQDELIVPECIDLSVVQLANSKYFATSFRQPTLIAAAQGGAFYPATSDFIQNFPICAESSDDIRDTLAIVQKILLADIPQEKKPPHMLTSVREIATLGTVCRELPDGGFDPRVRSTKEFRSAGYTATAANVLADVAQESPEVAAALKKLLANRRAKAATRDAAA